MKIESLEKGIKTSFGKVREELTEHLDAINQNTSELTSAYQYISELESKLEKLNERMDELTLQVQGSSIPSFTIDLTLREQEVFLALYTSSKSLSMAELAKQLGLTVDLVAVYVNKLASKGVPLIRNMIDELTFFALEADFKTIQARKQIVCISESVAAQFN